MPAGHGVAMGMAAEAGDDAAHVPGPVRRAGGMAAATLRRPVGNLLAQADQPVDTFEMIRPFGMPRRLGEGDPRPGRGPRGVMVVRQTFQRQHQRGRILCERGRGAAPERAGEPVEHDDQRDPHHRLSGAGDARAPAGGRGEKGANLRRG